MMELIAQHVRALREGDRRSRNAARALLIELAFDEDNQVLIAEAGGVPVLIDLLRDESVPTLVKVFATSTLGNLALTHDYFKIRIAAAGGIPLLVELLRDGAVAEHAALALTKLAHGNDTCAALLAEAGAIPVLLDILRGGVSSGTEWEAAILLLLSWAISLGNLACRDDNRVWIAEAGGIPVLLGLLRDGSAEVKPVVATVLENLALGNDANAVAISLAVGPEALVQLARRGRVTVDERSVVHAAGDHAKREAALCVAALDDVLGRVPDVVRAVIESYLWRSQQASLSARLTADDSLSRRRPGCRGRRRRRRGRRGRRRR